MVLVGWESGTMVLASVDEDYVPMTLSVALMVFLLSQASFAQNRLRAGPASVAVQAALGLASLSLALLLLLLPAIGSDLDLESMLHPISGSSGDYPLAETSPMSTATVVLASTAVLASALALPSRRPAVVAASLLSMCVFFVGLVTILGYAYGSPLLYGGDVRPVSLLSGVSFALLGVAQVASYGPERWPVSMFVGRSVEARLLRVFVPFVALVVLVSGSLSTRALAVSANPALTASLLAILTALVVGFAVARISRYVGGQIDRTEALRQKAEEELRLANQKLTVLGSMTRHDALNQLSVVLGRLELLKMKSSDPNLLKQLNESLESANIIRKMLEFTGQYQNLGVSGPAWIDVGEAFADAVHQLDPGRVRAESSVGDLAIHADIMFEKVLANLVDNSVRHGERVKTVRIHCEEVPEGLVLTYEDDGIGLSEQDKANLFKRGFGKHTGFGMYLSREILEFSGLGIRETGTYGQGARFEISVPRGKFRLGHTNI
jgi:signal transduction histidine kinase